MRQFEFPDLADSRSSAPEPTLAISGHGMQSRWRRSGNCVGQSQKHTNSAIYLHKVAAPHITRIVFKNSLSSGHAYAATVISLPLSIRAASRGLTYAFL